MPLEAIPQLEAVTYHRTTTTGRTSPCVFTCEDADGKPAGDFVVKLKGGLDTVELGLASELVSSRLAQLLGVSAPRPVIVSLSEELAQTIQDPKARAVALKSIGLNFATEAVEGFSTWARGHSVKASQFAAAADLFAFDVLLCNPDRRVTNPNLLIRGDDVLAIDHEAAFSFLVDFGLRNQKDLGVYCSADKLGFLRDHVFYSELRKKEIDFSRLDGAAKAIGKEELRQLADDVPGDWRVDRLQLILDYLKSVFSRNTSFSMVAKEVLAV
jgi:hypothetical protein